jgi:uncharacterized protein
MNRVFVDTSALLALCVATDDAHRRASVALDHLRSERAILVTSSYVLVETYALLGHRYGPEAMQAFREQFEPLLQVAWIDRVLHDRGLDHLLTQSARHLSLVDAVSLQCMRKENIQRVFAFDAHLLADGARAVV